MNPYVQNTPAAPPTTAANTLHNIGHKLESATRKTGNFAGNVFTHFRTGPGFVNVAKARLDQAVRHVYDGGHERSFVRDFGYIPGEKLQKGHACYLSIPNGPVLGMLYVSNFKVGFKSDGPVWSGPGYGPGQWEYYKIVLPVNQINSVNSVHNHNKSMEKHIEITTKDGHQFWFMGFIHHEKALSHLYNALNNYSNEPFGVYS